MRHPHVRWAIIGATFFLLEMNDMSSHAISFESTQTGVAPEGWTATLTGSGDPKWTVESDETAPSKSKVLKQSGRATYPLLLKNDSNIKDGFVEMKFKAIAGSQDRAAGMVWRAKDANNYYVVRANALEDNVVLYKTVNGTRSALDIVGRKGGYGIDVPVPANTWHSLRVDFKGSRFSVSFKNKATPARTIIPVSREGILSFLPTAGERSHDAGYHSSTGHAVGKRRCNLYRTLQKGRTYGAQLLGRALMN
jgi:hypothetical protein